MSRECSTKEFPTTRANLISEQHYNAKGDTDSQPLVQAKNTMSDHRTSSGSATPPLRISSSPGPTSVCSSSATCMKERLDGTHDGGWLSHDDFSTLLQCTLPTRFRNFEVPDFDPSTDWATWAARGRKQSTDPGGVVFCIINDLARKHWVLPVIDLDERVVSEYDSMYNVNHTMTVPARYITLRLGAQWEEGGWRHVQAQAPQQNDTKSCGLYALACIYCLVTGTAIPTSLDPRLWWQALAALAGATDLPLLPHRVVEPSLEQMTTVAMDGDKAREA